MLHFPEIFSHLTQIEGIISTKQTVDKANQEGVCEFHLMRGQNWNDWDYFIVKWKTRKILH